MLHQKNETRTKGSYVIDPQMKPEPWQVKYLEVMFDKYAEMYAVMVRHLLGIWGSQKDRTGLFADEQFLDSWRLPFVVDAANAREAVREKILKKKQDKLSAKDREFLEQYDSRQSVDLAEIERISNAWYGGEKKRKTLLRMAKKYAKDKIAATVINEKYREPFENDPKRLREKDRKSFPEQTFSQYGFETLAYNIANYEPSKSGRTFYDRGITFGMAKDIAHRVWKKFSEKINGFGKKVVVKIPEDVDTIGFCDVAQSMVDFRTHLVRVTFPDSSGNKKMEIPFFIGRKDKHLEEEISLFLADENAKLTGVVIERRQFACGAKYFLHATVDGTPIVKDGVHLGTGQVGNDAGPGSTYFYSREQSKMLAKLFRMHPGLKSRIAELQRRMDASDRENNPDNYDEKGRSKKGARNVHSKNYLKMQRELNSLYRRAREWMKNTQGDFINHEVLPLGDFFVTEKNPFSNWMKRDKEGRGKHGKKRRYGKSIGESAIASFTGRVKTAVERLGGRFKAVPCGIAATQFDHTAPKGEEFNEGITVDDREIMLHDRRVVHRDEHAAMNLAYAKADSLVERDKTYKDGTPVMKDGEVVREVVKSPENFDYEAMRKDEEKLSKFSLGSLDRVLG